MKTTMAKQLCVIALVMFFGRRQKNMMPASKKSILQKIGRCLKFDTSFASIIPRERIIRMMPAIIEKNAMVFRGMVDGA